jgi:hypothetical protein
VGKKYRPVDELDAMILRVVQQSQAMAPPTDLAVPATAIQSTGLSIAQRPVLARLPKFE